MANRAPQITTVTILGNEVMPKIGSFILLGKHHIGKCLLQGDDYSDNGYAGSQFRWPVNSGPIQTVACNVEITGRTVQRKNGANFARVKMTFVGDCEPDQHIGGWIKLDW